jgi:hypothetical protein
VGMTLQDAVTLAHQVAAECGETLGDQGWHRAAGADQNSHYWAILFSMKDGPPDWVWLFNLNDAGEPQIMIAHNPKLGTSLPATTNTTQTRT